MKRLLAITALIIVSTILGSSLFGCATSTRQETPQEFFKGKSGEILVGYAAGGAYDLIARLLAPRLQEYTGATWVVNNIPVGAGLKAANDLYNTAKPDGLTIFFTLSTSVVVAQVAGMQEASYDLRKFEYLGSIRQGYYIFCLTTKLPFKTIEEIVNSKQVIRFAATSRASESSWLSLVVFKSMGMNVKPVVGYSGGPAIFKAMAGGENDVYIVTETTALPAIKAGQARAVTIMTSGKPAALADVPTIFESSLLTGEAKWWCEQYSDLAKVTSSFVTSPGVPRDRVDFLEASLQKIMKEQTFTDAMEKQGAVPLWVPAKEQKQIFLNWVNMDPNKLAALKDALKD